MCKCNQEYIKLLYDDNDGDFVTECKKCGEIIENGVITKNGKSFLEDKNEN